MTLEIKTPELIVSDNPLEITANTQNVLIGEGTKELEVTVNRREYSIVGDELYIPKRYEDAPQWLRDIIDTVTNAAISGALSDVSTLGDMLNGLIAELDVAKNTYTQSIISSNDIDERINTAITTLNSSLADSDSTILDIAMSRVTPKEAQTIVLGILSASINGGDIAAAVQNLQLAIANVDSARALDYTRLTAQIGDGLDEEVAARAEAVQYLNTYVGIDADGGLVGTGLLADVSILQKQNDGVIETTTGTYDVMSGIENPNTNIDNDQLLTSVEPYVSWTPMSGNGIPTYNGEMVNRVYKDITNTKYYIVENSSWVETTEAVYTLNKEWLRSAHVGDVYIKYTSSTEGYKTYDRAYKFIKTVVDETSPYSTDAEGYTWALIVDTDAQNAYVAALNAYDLADNKRRVFVDTPVGPYDGGDLWVRVVSGSTQIWRCILPQNSPRLSGYLESEWQVASTDDKTSLDIISGTTKIDLSKHVNDLGWQTANETSTTASSILSSWVSSVYTPSQISTQSALDGKIESYFQSTTPYAASSGTASKDGDLWYNTSTKKLYRYVFSSKTWSIIEDQTAINAAAAASLAQSTADGKIVTYVGTTQPTAEGLGDIWIDTDDSNHMYRWDLNNWISIRDTTNDLILSSALEDIAGLEETNDGVINSFYQTTAPTTGMSYGDWWVDTDSNPVKAYRYEDVNGKNVATLAWRDNSTHILGKSYIAAVGAQSTADGKIKTFYQNSVPTSEGAGDLWIDLDDNNKTYRAAIKGANEVKSGEWVRVTDDSALDSFLNVTYASDLLNTQNQLDGVAVTYFQNTAPYAASAGLVENAGDVWYNPTLGIAYKFVYKTFASDGTTVTSASTWSQITNAVILSALSSASATIAAADRSIKNYTTQPFTPYYEGDTWMQGSTGDIYVCDVERLTGSFLASDWVIASKYTNDDAVVLLKSGLANGSVTIDLTNAEVINGQSISEFVAEQIDNEVVVYSGTNVNSQTGMKADDIYIESTTETGSSGVAVNVVNTYVYSGTAWEQINSNDNLTALADLADGKRTVFSGSTIPTTGVARDIWIPSANVTVGTTTYVKGEIYQYSGTVWTIATKYSADIIALKSNLERQIDSKVETYYQSTVPTGMTASNNGDYWYCTLDIIGTGTASSPQYVKGMIYKYTHSNTSWSKTADVSRYAFDVADGKAAIFLSTSTPTAGYKINDILIVIGSFNNGTTTFSDGVVLSSNANRVSGFTAGDWVKKINDTEDLDAFVSVTYTPTVTSLQNQVDGKIESWYTASTSDPKIAWTDTTARAKHEGDMWYQTDTKKSYWYSSSTHSWNLIDDAKAIQALANAATAQATADGVVVSFYAIKQDTAPTTTSMWLNKTGTKVLKEYKTGWINVAVQTGDTLMAYDPVTKDMSTYVYNGSGWITNTENGIVAGSEAITTLTANLSTTNTTVSGHTTQLNTVDTRIANGVAAVETKWAYNSVVNINGASYQSGFGLATSLTSGSGLPTGASEFWIKADKFKLMSADGGKKSSYSPFSVDATTGDITFNGKVTFSSISDSSTYIPTISSVALAKSDAIDYTKTAISKLKGINLVPEKYSIFSGTALPPLSIYNGTIDRRVDSALVKYGSASLMTWTTAGDCYVYLGAGSSDYNVKVPIGVSIIISIYVKPAWTDVNAELYIRNSAGDHFGTNARVTAGMWNRISLTHTTVTDSLIIRVDNDSWDELGSTSPMAIDGVMVEVNDGTGIPSEFRVGSGISAASWQSEVQAAINNNATTIDGAKITTGTINTNRLNVNDIMAKDMTFTGKITGGSGGLGGIIKSYNNKMTIDLVNGSIYIA